MKEIVAIVGCSFFLEVRESLMVYDDCKRDLYYIDFYYYCRFYIALHYGQLFFFN